VHLLEYRYLLRDECLDNADLVAQLDYNESGDRE
jgi:hypothetical protein